MSRMDLELAQRILNDGAFTCVLCRGEITYTSTARGVKPLLDWLEQGTDLHGFSAADKVVGKATAYLYCLLGVECVFARVMSRGAMDILRQNRILAHAEKIVPFIINRSGDGPCPMEQAVADAANPHDARTAIQAKLAQMNMR